MAVGTQREGIYGYIEPIHFVLQQKITHHCEAIILQLKKKKTAALDSVLPASLSLDTWKQAALVGDFGVPARLETDRKPAGAGALLLCPWKNREEICFFPKFIHLTNTHQAPTMYREL